eukprot:CAMPEP_0179216426 /NCGR_PEP_ID=MMETSP0797-20121207/3373_1 /TAXON_ID=47934 /ORGANISM="Dinophysis acuminata, Strain DAEP01" /LENGTH=699 /DNA_ID=CAMNT_0020922585 /DNA_START=260 /DNA_END=2355 /DNA_ORIENTATION=+
MSPATPSNVTPNPNAAVALHKVEQILGAHIHNGGATMAEREAGEDILAGRVGERTFSNIKKVLNHASLSDAAQTGSVINVEDMNRLAECYLGQPSFLEERSRSSSGVPIMEGDLAMPENYQAIIRRLKEEADGARGRGVGHVWDSREAAEAWKAAVGHVREQVPCMSFNEVAAAGANCFALPSIIVTSVPNDGCWSYVGQVSGSLDLEDRSQPLNLGAGCETKGMASHQLGHALGMLHQQSRSSHGKKLLAVEDDALNGTKFDILSVMHSYPPDAGTGEEVSVAPHDQWLARYIGQRMSFSQQDIERLGDMYRCRDTVTPETKSKQILLSLLVQTQASKAPITKKGCLCQEGWVSEGKADCATAKNGWCCNPDNNSVGSWCLTQGLCNGDTFDFCDPEEERLKTLAPTTRRGCTCRSEDIPECATAENGFCCNSDEDPLGAWCHTETECSGVYYDYCTPAKGRMECTWNNWSDWTECGVPCGGGTQARTRKVKHDSAGSSQACPGGHNETRSCRSRPCPIEAAPGTNTTVTTSTASGTTSNTTSTTSTSSTSPTTATSSTTTTTSGHLDITAVIHLASQPDQCVDVSRGNGTVLRIRKCSPSGNIQFLFPANGTGHIRWAAHPDVCLDAAHWPDNQFRKCVGAGGDGRTFVLPLHGKGAIRWASQPEMCLHVLEGVNQSRSLLQFANCSNVTDAETEFL